MKAKRLYGVGIAVKKNLNASIDGIINISPRLMVTDLTVKGFKLHVVSAYAPTENKPLSAKKSFYRDLNKVSQVDKNRKLFIQGDFNATSSICLKHSSFDGHPEQFPENETFNENGSLLLEFCGKNKLSILNTWFAHPSIHRTTWHSPDGFTKKVYDLSLSGSWLRSFVKDQLLL